MQTFPSSYAAGSPEETVAKAKDRMVARNLFGTENQTFNIDDGLKHIPKFAQSQRSLEEQLAALRAIANRVGLYDAADYIQFEQRESR